MNEHSDISPDHQLPAFVPRHKVLRVVMWSLLLLVFAIPLVLVLHHHEEAKEAAAARRVTPGIAITSATARKGNIGVYLDAIGTVTPVYTDSITSQVNGLVVAVHYTEGQRYATVITNSISAGNRWRMPSVNTAAVRQDRSPSEPCRIIAKSPSGTTSE